MKRFIPVCVFIVLLGACEASGDVKKVEATTQEVALENPFIHSVYIWFKEGVTEEQLALLYQDTENLRTIEVVKALYTGKPAATNRPMVERSYDFAIILHFEGLAGHDIYQEHPIHQALLKKHSALWERVMITDVHK